MDGQYALTTAPTWILPGEVVEVGEELALIYLLCKFLSCRESCQECFVHFHKINSGKQMPYINFIRTWCYTLVLLSSLPIHLNFDC